MRHAPSAIRSLSRSTPAEAPGTASADKVSGRLRAVARMLTVVDENLQSQKMVSPVAVIT